MSSGRRGLLLSATFLGSALWICPVERARAQPIQVAPERDPQAGRHAIWQRELSPEQIRQLLARFGQGDKNAGNQLQDAIRDQLLKNNPNAGQNKDQIDAAIKRMLADKDFMNWALDQAQKHKNQNPPGKQFEITPEMIENLKKRRADNGGDPFQLPKGDPNPLPKFDPKQLPNFDPKNPPKIDPDTGFPLDNRTGRPFDPRTGRPVDPKNPPPKLEPIAPPKIEPKVEPPRIGELPPKIEPKVEPPPAEPNRKFDPNNPLGAPKDSPEKAAKTKAVETATALWEKNVGPLEESPAVRRAIIDLVNDPDAMNALTDNKGNSIFDALRDTDGDGISDLFGNGGGSGWEWPKLDLNFNWGRNDRNFDIPDAPRRNNRWPDTSSSSRRNSPLDSMGSFNFGGAQVPWLLVLLLLAAIVAAVLWWKWPVLFSTEGRTARPVGGVGPWPVDPRAINTREDVVKAFEYLSVLLCGEGAKTWTHSTIADELTALAASNGDVAVKLARLYELARYAPLDEPLTRAEIIEARRLACDLAGVDEA